MKFNYRNTALKLLHEPNMPFGIPDDMSNMTKEEKFRFGFSFRNTWKNHLAERLKRSNIRYISPTFYEAYLKGKSKLVSVFENETICESGTLIIPRNPGCNSTIFYAINLTPDKSETPKLNIVYIMFNSFSKQEHPILDVLFSETNNYRKEFMARQETGKNTIWEPVTFLAELVGLLLFLKYVEVETKYIEPGRRQRHAGEKYINESSSKIEIIDSTYFTTIVRSEGFMVGADTGGFFRLQPYGPGLSKKKLIWVFPFEKHGYTRRAKIDVSGQSGNNNPV